jgi:orotate phosphoribosyltransferase
MNYALSLAVASGTLSRPTTLPRATVRCGQPAAVQELLSLEGALRTGHFGLLSGLHSDRFLAFSVLARDERALDAIAGWLSPTVSAWSPTVIVAPTTAGVSLASALARRIGVRLELAAVDEEGRPAQLGGDVEGDRAVVVNDVVTTGAGINRLLELTAASRAAVVGAAWFASRAPLDVAALLGVAEAHVVDVDLHAWHKRECQLCEQGIPIELGLDLN